MQNNITFKHFAGFIKTICVVLCIALASGTLSAQTVTSTGGTGYAGDYGINPATNPGTQSVSFVIQNTTAAPLVLTTVSSQLNSYFSTPTGEAITTKLYYNSTLLSGPYNLTTGWTQIATGTATSPTITTGSVVTPVITGLSFVIPANTQYRFVLETSGHLSFSYTPTPTPNFFTVGGVTLKTGDNQIAAANVGYIAVNGNSGTANTPMFFGGSVVLVAAVPCAGTPAPGNTISSAASVCSGAPFTLSAQNSTAGTGVTYQWQSSLTGAAGSFTDITGATASSYSATQTSATYYRVNVTCSGATTATTPVLVGLNTPSACYCTAGATSTSFEKIANVKYGTINNSSTSTAGYENFLSIATDAILGATSQITVTGNVDVYSFDQVVVWIDFNHNGSYNDPGETVYTSLVNAGPYVGNITIPTTALTGPTRMRVRLHDSSFGPNATSCGTSTYGQVEDYTLNIIPCVPIAFTTQPANTTAACGAAVTLTGAVSGSLPVYQWEYKTSAASTNWLNVTNGTVYSGATTPVLTIASATSNLNGYQYRLVVSGACSALDFSSVSTLTVNPLVGAVTPAASSLCLGAIQQLSITTTQPATVLTFSSAAALNLTIPDDATTVGVSNIIPVSGIPAGVTITSIKIKPNITHSWAGDLIVVAKAPNNKVLNLAYALDATGGTSATTAFTPTFSSTANGVYLSTGTNPYNSIFSADGYDPTTGDPTIPTGPNGFLPTSTATARNTFADLYTSAANSSTLNGNWTLAMYDYYDDYTTSNKFNNWSIEITYTGGLATGVWTSPTPNSLYTDAAATVPYNGTASVNTVYAKPTTAGVTTYTVVVNNGVCTSAPISVPVTVISAPTALSAVASKAICVGGTTTFTSTATGGSGFTYQWLVSTNGGTTYTAVANGGVYSGATTNTLTVTGATAAYNGYRYALSVVSAPCAATTTLTSTAGVLTVNPTPVIVISASPYTALFPGLTTTLTAAVSPTTASNYTWYRDGIVVPGAVTNTLVGITVDQLGTYSVAVNDNNSCPGTSNTITIRDSATANLFIYPNPTSNGKFHVRYFDQIGTATYFGARTLTIFDNKGSRVFSKVYSATSAYTDMTVDISNQSKGIYTVDLTNSRGERLKTGRVIVL